MATKIQANRIREGMILNYEGKLVRVMKVQHITPGKGRAFVQAKMKDIITGTNVENKFASDDVFEKAHLDNVEMEFIYTDGENYYFMNLETYEQIPITAEFLGDSIKFLKENMKVNVQFYKEQPVGIELPRVVVLEVVETEPELKGATVTASTKPAKLENGITVQVPQFIKNGDKIKVNTQEFTYIERA